MTLAARSNIGVGWKCVKLCTSMQYLSPYEMNQLDAVKETKQKLKKQELLQNNFQVYELTHWSLALGGGYKVLNVTI